jgi:hypothetical protein
MQKGKYLVPFGGLTRFPTKEGREVVYIDLNPKLPKPYILGDAFEIMQEMIKNGERWDGLILDPPYTYYQTVRTYGMKRVQEITQLRTLTERLVNEDGWVITLGYNSTGMGESRGWTKQEIMIVNLGGSHNDIIITVEMRDQSKKRKRYFEELDALVNPMPIWRPYVCLNLDGRPCSSKKRTFIIMRVEDGIYSAVCMRRPIRIIFPLSTGVIFICSL